MKRIIKKEEREEKKVIAIPANTEHVIECEDKVAYLRKIDKKTLKAIAPILFDASEGKEPDYVTAGEIILNNLFIGGDADFLTDDELNFAGALQCVALIKFKVATLKKN